MVLDGLWTRLYGLSSGFPSAGCRIRKVIYLSPCLSFLICKVEALKYVPRRVVWESAKLVHVGA